MTFIRLESNLKSLYKCYKLEEGGGGGTLLNKFQPKQLRTIKGRKQGWPC